MATANPLTGALDPTMYAGGSNTFNESSPAGLLDRTTLQTAVNTQVPANTSPLPTPAQSQAIGTTAIPAVAQAPAITGTSINANPTTPAALATATQSPNGTVNGQLANIIDQNSPLMQRAAARANADSNSRGLLNSSMAVGAAQGAVMDAALPIAQQDASSNNQFALTNSAAKNQNNMFNTSNEQQTNLTNVDAANRMNTQNVSNVQQTSQNNVDSLNRFSLTGYTMNADRQTKELVSSMDANTKLAVQSSASAAAAFMGYMNNIQAIQNGTSLTKTQDIQDLFKGMQDTINVIGQIGGLKTTTGAPLSSLLVDPTA